MAPYVQVMLGDVQTDSGLVFALDLKVIVQYLAPARCVARARTAMGCPVHR